MIGLFLGGAIILGVLGIDLCLAQFFHSAPMFAPKKANAKFVQIFSLDKDFKNLFRAVSSSSENFSTLWDFDEEIRLSRSLFIPTKMFGKDKYRYLPNISIFNCRTWTGWSWAKIMFAETPLVNELLNKTAHDCSRAETDS